MSAVVSALVWVVVSAARPAVLNARTWAVERLAISAVVIACRASVFSTDMALVLKAAIWTEVSAVS